jgi:hypothetical protein
MLTGLKSSSRPNIRRRRVVTVQALAESFRLGSKPLVLILARKADGAIDQDTDQGKAIRSKILNLSRSQRWNVQTVAITCNWKVGRSHCCRATCHRQIASP